MHRYKMWNGAMPTTSQLGAVTTGTSLKTMLQLATPATRRAAILAWGFSLEEPPGADGVVEFLESGGIAATVTAHVASGLMKLDDHNAPDSLMAVGTSATGYTSTSEGAITTTRLFDAVTLSSVSGESPLVYEKEFTSKSMPIIAVSRIVRIRAITPTTAVDMRCWIAWDE